MTDPRAIAAKLTPSMQAMVMASGPDDITGREGCGVELTTMQHYGTARALGRRGLGQHEAPGGFLKGMYFNKPVGLAVRAILTEGS